MASPSVTFPSSGIIPPVATLIVSPARTSLTGTSTSPSAVCSQTLSTFSAMLRARSATDFLCVHSSSVSPTPSRNMMEPAVAKSPRSIDTAMAVASSTGTCIRPRIRQPRPAFMYRRERSSVIAVRSGTGRRSLLTQRRMTELTSFSSYSRSSARELCASARCAAALYENAASAATMSARDALYTMTVSHVRS